MAETVLNNILLQLFYFIVIIFSFGYLISVINKMFYKLTNNDKRVAYATGIIGTPIHELSHAAMCIVFMHRINEIRLFHIDPESGNLGYVSHSFNKKNLYQVVGNYFIGTAPIVGGTLFIYFLIKVMLPEAFEGINNSIAVFSQSQTAGFDVEHFTGAFATAIEMIKNLFFSISEGVNWWIFMLLSLCIALHMNLSTLDIKGSLKAIPYLVVLVAFLNFILAYVFDTAYIYYVGFMNSAGSFLAGALILSAVLALVCLFVAFIIKILINAFK